MLWTTCTFIITVVGALAVASTMRAYRRYKSLILYVNNHAHSYTIRVVDRDDIGVVLHMKADPAGMSVRVDTMYDSTCTRLIPDGELTLVVNDDGDDAKSGMMRRRQL